MSFSISVSPNPRNMFVSETPFFQRTFVSEAEYGSALALISGPRRIGFPQALVTTVRTNNCANFCADFFFPMVVNSALKAEGIAQKLFLSIGAIWFDLLTLPIRLIQLPSRIAYNREHSKERNPFYRFLIQSGVDSRCLSSDSVFIEITTPLNGSEGRVIGEAVLSRTFDFIELPQKATPRYQRQGESIF